MFPFGSLYVFLLLNYQGAHNIDGHHRQNPPLSSHQVWQGEEEGDDTGEAAPAATRAEGPPQSRQGQTGGD